MVLPSRLRDGADQVSRQPAARGPPRQAPRRVGRSRSPQRRRGRRPGLRILEARHGDRTTDEQDCQQQQRHRERAVRRAQQPHDTEVDDRGLSAELDEPVGRALRCGVGDLGGVLHAERQHGHQEEAENCGEDVEQPTWMTERDAHHAGHGRHEGDDHEADPLAPAIGERREHDGADDAGDQHQTAHDARFGRREAPGLDDLLVPGGHAVEGAHDDEGDAQHDEERLDREGVLETVEHERTFVHARRARRRRRPLTRQGKKDDRRGGREQSEASCTRAIDMLLARIGVSAKPTAMPSMLASVTRPTAVARSPGRTSWPGPWSRRRAGTAGRRRGRWW